MDYPLAITIALPASTFIVTCGTLIVKKMNRDESGDTSSPSVSRGLLDSILDKKFKNVRYVGECKAISEGIGKEMSLTREVIHDGLEAVRKEVELSRGKI